jgi:regulator of Ty1 transposition protein 103
VDAHRLVQLWVAEDFVRPRRGCMMEEVGQGYLKELISRCLVQLVHRDEAQEASFVESHDSAPPTCSRRQP